MKTERNEPKVGRIIKWSKDFTKSNDIGIKAGKEYEIVEVIQAGHFYIIRCRGFSGTFFIYPFDTRGAEPMSDNCEIIISRQELFDTHLKKKKEAEQRLREISFIKEIFFYSSRTKQESTRLYIITEKIVEKRFKFLKPVRSSSPITSEVAIPESMNNFMFDYLTEMENQAKETIKEANDFFGL